MEFHINKDSTLPVLKLELINDGRNDFKKFNYKIQNANIFFTMTDVITGVKRIARKLTTIEQVEPRTDCTGDEFYLTFKFNKKQTSHSGRYVGQFEIDFLDGSGNLIVPIREELFINILDGSIKK
jgi:hypothetical protein